MKKILLSLLLTSCYLLASAQTKEITWQEPIINLPLSGKIAPRSTHDIEASNWSVGGETMDRDYTIYANWKDHVEDLGIKKIRLQSGWAKTEKELGKYDFQWLDDIVFDLDKKGVEPWISLSYGNPLYKGGGGTLLGARLPTSGEALQGWLAYVRANVNRYKDVVDEWEVWNEPNLSRAENSPDEYANMLLQTGKTIKEIQPDAKVLGIAIAGINPKLASDVLQYLKANNGLQYVDAITYHPYNRNPDASYEEIQRLRDTVQKYAPEVFIYQGENGAPSEFRNTKALNNYNWTELSQAKWALRRLLGDLGRDIPTSYFSIVDMKYPDEINRKGLLLIDDDKKVIRRKHAYSAVQHLSSVFDNSLKRLEDYPVEDNTYHSLSTFAYEKEGSGQQIVTIWFDGSTPSDYNTTTQVDFTFPKGKFENPVYVDLRTGSIYDIPEKQWRKEGDIYTFYDIPVYDSPILIADKSAVMVR